MNRRRFILNLGATLVLPKLQSLGNSIDTQPSRMVFVFSPNGMNTKDWLPIETGVISEMPKTLKTIEEFQNNTIIMSNLAQTKARANGDGPGDHARSMGSFLTGVQIKKTDGKNIQAGISADQIAANYFSQTTRIPSLQLGCEPAKLAGQCDSGYSCIYSSTISWYNSTLALPKENNPRQVFEKIFGDGTKKSKDRIYYRQSILDNCKQELKSVQKYVSSNDYDKLNQYFTAVREVERKIQNEENTPKEIQGHREYFSDIPVQFEPHCRLLIDLMNLSFKTDSTRVITLVLADEGSNRAYTEIGLQDGHHELSHHQNNQKKLDQISLINRYHTKQLNYLLQSLKYNDLFNNTIVCYGAGIADGNKHDHHNLPILISGGNIMGSKHIIMEKETPLNNLWLGVLNKSGININSFGDSSYSINIDAL